MVERRPVRLSPNLTKVTPTSPPAAKAKPDRGGVFVVALVIGILIAIAKCSPSTNGGTSTGAAAAVEEVGNAQQALVAAVAVQVPPPVQKLSARGVRSGASRVSLASREGLAGELIYSQNCYDALGRQFTWMKLDECGGFDVEASLSLGEEVSAGSERENAWFDGEAAAGRYLKAATAAGQEADAADNRLAALQAQVGRGHRPAQTARRAVDEKVEDGGKIVPTEEEGSDVESAEVATG